METGSTWQSHMEWVFPGSKDSRELKGGKLFGWQSHMQMHPSGAWQAARAGAYVCRPATVSVTEQLLLFSTLTTTKTVLAPGFIRSVGTFNSHHHMSE